MKKILLLALVAACSLPLVAQSSALSATYPCVQVAQSDLTGLDALFLFNGITSATEVRYTGTETNVEWRTFAGDFVSNQPEFSPDDSEGYILKVDGRDSLYIWVLDYAKYPVTISGVDVVEADDKCRYIKIVPIFLAPDLLYKDKNGATHRLPRTFTLSYDEITFSGEEWSAPTPKMEKLQTPFTEISLEAPLCDTQFTFAGDNWAQEFGIKQSVASPLYKAIAVEAHIKATIEERAAKNEVDRANSSEISGSGPLVVFFESRANPIDGVYYDWRIFPKEKPSDYMRYSDKDVRYTFSESGEYRVKLTVMSAECEYTDSIDVKVLESKLEVPNVFTPNGDGKNDEFRVAYRSLLTYSCYVYNRWGRQVFHSTDPAKGWDGTINGKQAAQGAYYYIIQATGTDLDKNGNPIQYKLSGDINLLRTTKGQ